MPTFEHAAAKIAYQTQDTGPPVLFIQGVGVPGSGWRPQLEGLADRFHGVAFDHRGLGGSSPVAGRLSIARSEQVNALLAEYLVAAEAGRA